MGAAIIECGIEENRPLKRVLLILNRIGTAGLF